ncbi:MAG: NAD(P) transhydrogenase subunit beta [Phycisphaerae bacterium]|nr:MAG: NAD(P) transhydrogenase subunit beta [Phycisphaerae bacterium]
MLKFAYILLPLLLITQTSAFGDDDPAASPSPAPVVTGTDAVADNADASEAGSKAFFSPNIVSLAYVLAAVLFISGIKGLTHPRTAVRGNLMASVGMLIAVVFTLGIGGLSFGVIFAGLIVGGGIGAYKAVKVEMTEMPEMVALFNGFGGVASVFVAGAAMIYESVTLPGSIATAASGLIGSVTLTGSLVAFAKLQGLKWVPDGPIVPAQKLVNVLLVFASVALSWWLATTAGTPSAYVAYWAIVVVAGVLGILLTTPIGGADMPVVIALLNSYSGLAACATGFVISNSVLIIAGSLVGASGLILCGIMCKAMNRSLGNVIFGTMGPTADTPDADEVYKTVKSSSPEEVAILFDSAQKAVIVPGYGMAVSQAQHAVRDLSNLLESRGCHVDFAVHPVAGRMPGHMNVLLAEANIDYDRLREMDDINPELEQYDVALVIGANDVVNPVARTDPNSPIAGMPIIDVDKCRTVVIVKRSLSPGFAGIPNPLFAAENALMMFGDGKKAVLELISAIKEG